MKENLKRLFTGCLTVPNLLSLIRIILIPVFGVLFYHEHVLAAVIVLAVSGLTDLFDGKIARRFNQVSELGKILDPIADKLTQMTIAVVLFKVATTAFYGVMILVIAFGPEVGALRAYFTLPDPVMIALVIIAALLTFAALLSYVPNTMQQFKEKKLKKQTKKED